MNIKVALIEIGNSHDECLYSQIFALKKANCKVYLVCNTALKERNPHFENFVDQFYLLDTNSKMIEDFNKIRKLVSFFKKEKISKVVCNTAQGGHIRNLALLAPKNIEVYGIVHTLKKFQNSHTQKYISRKIRNYFLLNDHFLGQVNLPKLKIESFYPLRYPTFGVSESKPNNTIRISVVGNVETRRKDMEGFKKIFDSTKKFNIQYCFLGKMNSEFVEYCELNRDRIIFFQNKISHEEMDAFLETTDFILPLIHPNTPSSDEYFKNQISGSINIAFAYNIPLLIEKSYENWRDFKLTGVFYQMNSLLEDFEYAFSQRLNLVEDFMKIEKFTPEFQEDKYLKFLGI